MIVHWTHGALAMTAERCLKCGSPNFGSTVLWNKDRSQNKPKWQSVKCIVNSFIHSPMELSPSWEPANCAATQELPSILWNLKVHCHVEKSPPLVPIYCKLIKIFNVATWAVTKVREQYPSSGYSGFEKHWRKNKMGGKLGMKSLEKLAAFRTC
jgi:hypothetical protein